MIGVARVRPMSELVGEIIASGPPAAVLAIGIWTSAQPELYGPTMPITSGVAA